MLPDIPITLSQMHNLLGPNLTVLLSINLHVSAMQRSTFPPKWTVRLAVLPMVKLRSWLLTPPELPPVGGTQELSDMPEPAA